MCALLNKTVRNVRLVREAVFRNSSIGACAIQQAEMGESIEVGNISDTQRRALQLSFMQIMSVKGNLAHERGPCKPTLKARGIFKSN